MGTDHLKTEFKGFTELRLSRGRRSPDSAVFFLLQELRPSGRSLKDQTCSYPHGLCPHSHKERLAPWTHRLLPPFSGMAPHSSCSPATTTTKLGELAFGASISTKAAHFPSFSVKSLALLGSYQSKTLSSRALPARESCFQPSKRSSFCFLPRLWLSVLANTVWEWSKTREMSF